MKRIVILCDGTWNDTDAPHPTNVVRLGQMVGGVDTEDRIQVPVYIEGVGTGRRGVTRLGRLADRTLGGGLGLGLMENVVEAYRHLVFLWEPGDRVMLFGFSRGAFTARSLAGFIRHTGLLARGDLDRLPEAVARYTRRRGVSAHERQMLNAEWRAEHSPHVLVDPADRDLYDDPDADRFVIDHLGVWDTVGALGVPRSLGGLGGRRFRFHDTALTPMVLSARHAVALDERRRDFAPTLWSNLDALNEGPQTPDSRYQERWFPGDHGAVGGGGALTGLSSIALGWLMDGAQAAGLRLDPVLAEAVRAEHDPAALPRNSEVPRGGPFAALMRRFGRDRDGPHGFHGVHEAARRRWKAGLNPAYRPQGLARLARDLDAWRDG